MSFTIENSYDSRIPQTVKNSLPYLMVVCHDTEGGTGRNGALSTKSFLINRADRNASYHEMWWYHESTDEFGVLRIVPKTSAAHSVNPVPVSRGGYYQPDAWVRTCLGSRVGDPNQAIYAVSIAGRVADVDRYSQNPKFLAHAHRRFLQLWQEFGINKRAEHFRFNPPPTRTDWGQRLTPALGGLVTPERLPDTAMEGIPMQLRPVREDWNTLIGNATPGGQFFLEGPGVGPAKYFTVSERVTSLGETADGGYLLVFYNGAGPADGEYLWMPRTNLRPIAGTRVPATGYATELPGGAADCTQAVSDAVTPLNAEIAELSGTVEAQAGTIVALNGTVEQQTGIIAGLKTELANMDKVVSDALARVAAAEALVVPAQRLRDALRDFMA